MGLEHPVGPFAVVVAEDLWFTGCFIGQAYFLAGLEHPVVVPFALVAEDLWFTGCFIGQAYF